jgi:hypothetical protein
MKFKVSLYVCKLHQYIELNDTSETLGEYLYYLFSKIN